MAFVLVVSGLLMIVTGAKGTYAAFGSQLASDFTGPHNFTYWLAAFGVVGSIGYIDALRTFSRLFMSLILISMVLANKGVFAQFTAALKNGPVAPPNGLGLPSGNPFATSPTAAVQGAASAVASSAGIPSVYVPKWLGNALQSAFPSAFPNQTGG